MMAGHWIAMGVIGAVLNGTGLIAHGQTVAGGSFAENIIVPQSRVFAWQHQPGVQITEVSVGVNILEQAATTVMDISLSNPGPARVQGELIVPVPEGVAVRGLTFQGGGAEPTAQILTREEGRRIYESIVAKSRDPALLEFVGCHLVRSSVFPIEGRSTQKVRLTYEHLLPADGQRVDYILPRSESLQYSVPWHIRVSIRSKRPISTVYSPSHAIETTRSGRNQVKISVAERAVREPGPFRVSYLLEGDGVSASLLTFPDAGMGGGYFLLLAGLPAEVPAASKVMRREVTLVLDCSGSMRGEKIAQAREAALQVLAGLEEGEAFNLITYSDNVSVYAPEPVIKSASTVQSAEAFVKKIQSGGGTNIHAALTETMRLSSVPGMLPMVLFLTDGLPTVGITSEAEIRDVALKSNRHERRIFSFGVGVDVNTPLLEKIATENRGTATFVLPGEDVEVKVAQVFKRLRGPVVADPVLFAGDGKQGAGRVVDMLPSRIPDLFAGDQLVVLGKYLGEERLRFTLRGFYLGTTREFQFEFPLDKASTRNAFIPRLWASRKIAVLVDAIRQLGAERPGYGPNQGAGDPRFKELVDEVVRLSTEFGVLTEYTAFLAREGTDLTQRADVLAEAGNHFHQRAILNRSGLGSVSQEGNQAFMKSQTTLNAGNFYYDERMNRVAISNVQQINDRAFYRRGARWIDSALIERPEAQKPAREIEFGSAEFAALIRRLAEQGRQGCISLEGDVLMKVDGEAVLIHGPK